MSTPEIKLAEKKKRVEAASSLSYADRVPFAPLTGYYPAGAYGINYYDIMIDPRNGIPGIKQYLEDVDPDMIFPPNAYCIPACEASGATFIRWPGQTFGIPLEASFQITDDVFMEDDEYKDFLKDPTHFLFTKIIPRRHKNLAGFAELDFRLPAEYAEYNIFKTMAKPEVRSAFMAAMKAGELKAEYDERFGTCCKTVEDCGTMLLVDGFTLAPYDYFADNYRGLISTLMDMYERPDMLEAALEYMTDVVIETVLKNSAEANATRVFIPIHSGVDEFMSPENYNRFYWSGLRRVIIALVDAGYTPVVFCEGNYSTRIDTIADVPKGKVEYMFEKVDMADIKKRLGPVACFYGNLPNALLISGSKEQVIDHTKRMLDICAPGGGFMMNCGIVLDNAKKENVAAWRETVETYGRY